MDDKCLNQYKVYEEYNINDDIFKLYGCSQLKEGGSIAIIYDDSYNFNMIVYDYKASDKEDIVELLKGATFSRYEAPAS